MMAPRIMPGLPLLTHNPEIVLGVLIEIFGLYPVTARSGVARPGHIALISAAGITRRLARIAVSGATLSRARWAGKILRTFRPELPPVSTFVQDNLRYCQLAE